MVLRRKPETIDFGDWKITATGVLDEYWDWRIDAGGKDWKIRECFSDREELEEYMWAEVQRINKKYSHCAFEEETEEVENEDYYEEDEE
jgi:hypothetical protein